MIVTQNRNIFHKDSTISRLFINSNYTGFSLEDTVRPYGVKIKNYTAIPPNEEGYNVAITYSQHFKRDMVVLYDYIKDGLYVIDRYGVVFTQVYSHGGNDADDTEGCIIVAKNYGIIRNVPKVWGSIEKKIFNIINTEIKNGNTVKWVIKNIV